MPIGLQIKVHMQEILNSVPVHKPPFSGTTYVWSAQGYRTFKSSAESAQQFTFEAYALNPKYAGKKIHEISFAAHQ